MWLTKTALVRNKSSRLFLGTTSEDVEIVFPKLCTAYQSVLLTDDLRLLGTRQKSQRDGTGTRVKTRLHIIMGGLFLPLIGVGEVSDTSGMSQPSLPFKLSFSYFK